MAAKKKAGDHVSLSKQVEPLDKEAFRTVIQIIDRAEFKGSEAGNVIMLKKELARAAGMPT